MSTMIVGRGLRWRSFAIARANTSAHIYPLLNGTDTIASTGVIGENSPEVRDAICQGLSWLGIELNLERNAAHILGCEGRISADTSRTAVYVIPTNAELLIARGTVRVVTGSLQPS